MNASCASKRNVSRVFGTPRSEEDNDLMRLVLMSDTHGLHNKVDSLPAGDVLVHAGDFMNSSYEACRTDC